MIHKIQYRFSFVFVIVILCILLAGSVLLRWTIRQSFENELGSKLETLAQTCTLLFEPEELIYLSGDIGPRFKQRLLTKLDRVKEQSSVKRIFLFDNQGNLKIDTEIHEQNKSPQLGLQFFLSEISKIKQGLTAHSILFQGIDGKPGMTGFAPIYHNNQVIAGIGVEGSASYLKSMHEIQNKLMWITIGSTLFAIISGFILSRTITQPIRQLAAHSQKIAAGDYKASILRQSRDEIGDLALAMEHMRKNILEREQELKAMVAGIAHEIRNPLGGIKLFSDLLSDEIPPASEAEKHITRIQQELQHLQNIVFRFLEYANPQKPQKEKVDLISILNDCQDLLKNSLEEKKIHMNISDADHIRILADPNHIKEVILNILQNAIQSMTQEGQLNIYIDTLDWQVKLDIRDDGPGIPIEQQADIFNPFFTTRVHGTGLGLSIAKSLMLANNGNLLLKQSNESGTIFSLTFEKNP